MRDRMIVLGITGGIGCGKSEALKFLKRRSDVTVCLADQVGAGLQEPGGAAYEPIVKAFGSEILCDDRTLNRARLAEIVFHQPEQLAVLNGIVHPLVMDCVLNQMMEARDEGKRLFALESAILIEAGYRQYCDEVWYIRVSDEVRMRRLVEDRGLSAEQAQSIMSRQMSDDQYRENCDVTIDNNSGLSALYSNINKELLRLGLKV